jgi:hypothetical protein
MIDSSLVDHSRAHASIIQYQTNVGIGVLNRFSFSVPSIVLSKNIILPMGRTKFMFFQEVNFHNFVNVSSILIVNGNS